MTALDLLSLLSFVLFLGVIIGTVLGWVSFFHVRALRQRVFRLEQALTARPSTVPIPLPEPDQATETPTPDPQPVTAMPSSAPPSDTSWSADGAPGRPAWLAHLSRHWMIWLGGLCVALAGVFMVKYSIDAGLLGPWGRVMMGLVTGIGLHVLAEWLRRKNGPDPSIAALAGGASITLYAALLAALHLYGLMDPRLIFVLLALVSLFTMMQSLLHGPALAAMGLVGAYGVPLLVSEESGNILSALLYALIISGAALLLLRRIFRTWLWWGVVVGALGWWLLSLTLPQADGFRGLYLALLAWGVLAIPTFDWRLDRGEPADTRPGHQPMSLFGRVFRLDQITLVLIILAWGLSIRQQGFDDQALWQWGPMVLLLALAARHRDSLRWLPWMTLGVQWLAWMGAAMVLDWTGGQYRLIGIDADLQPAFLQFAALMALLYAVMAVLHLRVRGFSHPWAALAFVSPLVWVALAYLLTEDLSRSPGWAAGLLLTGMIYGAIAAWRLERHRGETGAGVWFVIGGHLAYSLAAAIMFREAGLTLVLSAQLLSLAWVMKRYQLPWLDTLIKGILVLVVIRLTFNPWILSYPPELHWSLWTGGGATLFCALAAWQTRSRPDLQRWLEAGALHLLVLTLGAEVRYQLYDGNIFIARYSLTEAAINAALWSGLALTYRQRARHSQTLAGLYRLCSRLLLLMALGSYALAVTILNPLWGQETVATRPIANLLLLAYGLPVMMALLVARYHEARFRPVALAIAGLGLWLFITLEIRHLWQQGALSITLPTGNGELYTYSAAWLILAASAIVAGGYWRGIRLYRAGMALLVIVIAKLFLVDLSGLDGLWRVASFMGLGLSLLGLAWLHRRMGEIRRV
ncbi:hypothetical protein ECTPHS_05145 [Ectothiorhodospira sp. PHS-1]|uniref:DUF2339 domain-containing protein n=1 Tax=Ectothiorhodospira sp. PHS-1 TaxID=519989 RepID=UPI00024A81CA|nr:DUF2339 domain-containing protein [Ectothiorhodospira sp. PHS-1]EHQ52056.1 hypothetical protein ECTPHS_05145 [Ectothiorhodospira sp. PHS-1]